MARQLIVQEKDGTTVHIESNVHVGKGTEVIIPLRLFTQSGNVFTFQVEIRDVYDEVSIRVFQLVNGEIVRITE